MSVSPQYGLHEPIPGGSTYLIEFEGPKTKEVIKIYLPPVGYTIDRIPDPETGKPSFNLIKCEILGEDLPVEEQKWQRPKLPKEWKQWKKEEGAQQTFIKNWVHPEAERFRAQEWTRRINGCWQAIGNRNGKPSQYIYIPPTAYLYFAWWLPDFGHPKFRLVYLKSLLALQWAEDHPLARGIVLSTHRRHGKTSVAGCWCLDLPSRMDFGYGAMQGQAGKKALEFFDIHLMQPFRRMVEFFRPRYDHMASIKSQLIFTKPPRRGKESIFEDDDDEDKYLGGRITCVNSSDTSIDGKKAHRIWLDEPGKWSKVDVYSTVMKYVPCTSNELRQKIGLLFVPSTVEDLDKGGEEFIKLFESSVPSLMEINSNGKTATELVSMFIPAYEGVVFDEYGRSVVEDPLPGEIVLDDNGKQIKEGAKTMLSKERASKITEQDRIEEIRKYPWTWFEAKMVATFRCQFNSQILTTRLQQLQAMPRMPWIRGNYQWKEEVDGDVIFVRDDISGRFQVAWMPDEEGGDYENNKKIINNVGWEWNEDKKLFYPRNDRLFAAGADPIAYKAKGLDKRLSNGAAHIFRKYDPNVDAGRPMEEWDSYNFVVQYLFRPQTFEMYGEDMIKMVRYWGCSINAEDNVQALRQHFDNRGYGAFIMFRRDFVDNALITGIGDLDRPLRSNNEVIDHYTSGLNTFFYRHGMRCKFAEMLEQGLQFDPNDTQFFDAIVSAGYTLIGANRKRDEEDEDDSRLEHEFLMPMYSSDGWKSNN